MLGLIPRILAVVVAIAIGGNTGFCACCPQRQPKPATQTPAPEKQGCSKCGHENSQTPAPQPHKDSPKPHCPNCENTNKPDRAIEKAPTHAMTIPPMALPAPLPIILPPAPAHIALDRLDTSPPILLDLFHSFILLTI